jgi:hypothetical protein
VFAESAAWLGLAMSLATADLPADPDALRAFALACQAELKAAELSVQLRSLEIEKLKFQIAKLRTDAVWPSVGTDQPPDRAARIATRRTADRRG